MLPYSLDDKQSILDYAKRLEGKTLREACDARIVAHQYGGKGNFGQILEDYYFLYKPNSDAEPDFPLVGLELKSSPLKQLQGKEYRSKERLVLNIINFETVAGEQFESSSFWKKNAAILLVFYLHEPNKGVLDYTIKLVGEWAFPKTDLEIIRNDWNTIQQKILAGKAHEISEGDTFYLGACTKGSKGGNPRTQPFSEILAKQRAYSFKQGYVNHIVASISKQQMGVFGKIILKVSALQQLTLEEIVVAKFEPYYNKTVEEIQAQLGLSLNETAKQFYAALTNRMLGFELHEKIEEFEKAEITLKTVRLKENNLPKEDISFPAFDYKTLVLENWDESSFKEALEHKFLFVFFQVSGHQLLLRKVRFWNMPYADLEEAKRVWEKTQSVVENGEIVKKIENGRRSTRFPNKAFSPVAHVRPHAKDAADERPLPTPDHLTGQKAYTKHSFWLNNTYIRDEIYLK